MAEMVSTILNGEFPLIIPKHRADRPDWYTDVGWEKPRLKSMHEGLGEGDVIYYVGAEEGEMPALCATWGADVFLFEPNAKVWPNIRAIWEANGLKKPGYFVGFASDVSELNPPRLDFDTSDTDGWPTCAYGPVIGNHGFRELAYEADAVPQLRIDDVHYTLNYAAPTAITMDVEGSEWKVLKGAEGVLREYRPKIWLSGHPEFMFRMFDQYLYDLRNWIKDFGYKETFLDYQHEVHFLYEAK